MASPPLKTPPHAGVAPHTQEHGRIAIDSGCRVIDGNGLPINGLYAVGELTGLAGINDKPALEGTFLGPCIITGRVAARTILVREASPPLPELEKSPRCVKCHDIDSLINEPRPGFWHFEQSHRTVLQREMACLLCHTELAPYDEDKSPHESAFADTHLHRLPHCSGVQRPSILMGRRRLAGPCKLECVQGRIGVPR